ncbi:hypothetical protein PHISCL_07520 [Aspergillus sclerotialis]|uniref:Uncharacterized protein n=1 Tax=Aspergillus sclerotialis TaxID=2070753 RepID=A0A3A2ZFL5_9EURO|nr:hypothetical protein PHISCL_07520 [Aspergillus sclerotialis]
MSTPNRQSDGLYLSRHNREKQQERSPFRRAHRESHPVDDLDHSRILSSKKHGSRKRHNFRKTRTLRGAFAAASRGSTMSEEAGSYGLGNGPSPRWKWRNVTSPPPEELEDIYKQIEEEDSLTDLDYDEEDCRTPVEDRIASRLERPSTGSVSRENDHGEKDVFGGYNEHLLDDITDQSPRRVTVDHAKDEQRLKHATASHSPVFSRARVGRDGLTSETLQRRDEEAQRELSDDNDTSPSLNLPSTWGSRAAKRNWLRYLQDEGQSWEEKRNSTDVLGTRPKAAADSSAGPISTSERSPGRRGYPSRSALGERTLNSPPISASRDESKEMSPGRKNEQRSEEDKAPNTPVLGYKTSTFTKPSPTKRDSQQLLRKLSRSVGSDQDQSEAKTPEQSKAPQSRIYDKTPVVTGAWIDTPVTEKSSQFPDHLSTGLKSAISKTDEPAKHSEPVKPSQRDEEKSRVEEITETEPHPAKEKTRPQLIKPKLPKSGLETVMEDVRADKDSLALGDDTMESLQLMLDEQPAEFKTEKEEEAESEKAILKKLDVSRGKGTESKNSAVEAIDYDRFNGKLQSLIQNLSEVKKGLTSLEEHTNLLSSVPSSAKRSKMMHHLHDGEACQTCGLSSDGRLYAALPLPRLWNRDPVSRRIRLTRLGWCTLIFTVWLLSESTMCDYYGHPLIADACEGNCLMYNAPRFPFVVPTMLWRWLNLSNVLAPLIAVFVALFKLIAQLLGLWDGYVDDVPRNLNLSGEIRIRGSQVTDLPAATRAPGYKFMPKNIWQGRGQAHSRAASVEQSVPSLNLKLDEDQDSMDGDEYVS